MPLLHSISKKLDKISQAKTVHAHCDYPCGIYDPHLAQLAAHTVIRMVDLINSFPKPTSDTSSEELEEYYHALTRATKIKEEHAELCKHEVRILWGDYFKPEHVKKYPELHELVWKVMKLGSKAKQEINLQSSEDLLETVNKIAEIFWETKDIETVRAKAPYPTGREMVYPKVK